MQVPLTPQIVATANMRDGIGETAIDQAEAAGRKARRHGIAIGTVSIEMQRSARITVLAHDHADRDHGAVARRDLDPLGRIEIGIVATRYLLLLEQFELAAGDMVVIDRIRVTMLS